MLQNPQSVQMLNLKVDFCIPDQLKHEQRKSFRSHFLPFQMLASLPVLMIELLERQEARALTDGVLLSGSSFHGCVGVSSCHQLGPRFQLQTN